LVLLLGAGASVAAGVPTTFKFVDQFLAVSKKGGPELEEIVRELRREHPKADVETLLRLLYTGASDEPVPEAMLFARPKRLPPPQRFQRWVDFLETFICRYCFVKPNKVGYMEPVRGLLANYKRPLDVFTANYDTSIEVFCLTRGIEFSNGFLKTWQPDTLEDERVSLRLHKLHGSVTWWSTDEGVMVEIPVEIIGTRARLYYGPDARSLVIFPGTSAKTMPEPTLTMLGLLKERLAEADVLVVAGYSFRDDDIRRIVLEAVRNKRKLVTVLIGPSAFKIYEEKLKWSSQGVPSPLWNRVACLPFMFEKVFGELQNRHLRDAINGLRGYDECVAEEVRSGGIADPQRWAYACDSLASGGFVELAVDVMKRWLVKPWPFDSHLHSVVSAAVIAGWAGAKQLWDEIGRQVDQLADRLALGVRIDVVADRLVLRFDLSPPGQRQALVDVRQFLALFDGEKAFVGMCELDALRKKGESARPALVSMISEGIDNVLGYVRKNWPLEGGDTAESHLRVWGPFVDPAFPGSPLQVILQEFAKRPDLLQRPNAVEGRRIREAFWLGKRRKAKSQ
jgi:hypothetical protein